MEPAPHLDVRGADAAEWLARALACLGGGGALAIPTESFYGLAVDCRDRDAVGRLLKLKGYAPGRPVLLLAASVEQVRRLTCWNEARGAAALAQAFWPGPLTLVIRAAPGVELAACPTGTLAIRVSSHPVPRRLAGALGAPVTGTSANPAGSPPARTASEAAAYFPGGLGVVLDAGPCAGGRPSTLLDLSGGVPTVLRQGSVSPAALGEVLGRPVR
jgi:L-threonylcarbamoyladenylate synthase